MTRLKSVKLNNEDGAVIWVVLVISFIILLIVTSSFTYLLEHRQILQMRLQQLQATELVKNGIVFIKNKLALGEVIEQNLYIENYSTGRVEIAIIERVDQQLIMKIRGYTQNNAVQTYKVGIDIVNGHIIQYEKAVN